MGRTKGALNKHGDLLVEYAMSPADRLQLLAGLLVEIISEELCADN
jgi:hypothetical protein